jgi:hypothetical protein
MGTISMFSCFYGSSNNLTISLDCLLRKYLLYRRTTYMLKTAIRQSKPSDVRRLSTAHRLFICKEPSG